MASPSYGQRHPHLGAAEDFDGVTLLHDAAPWDDAPEHFEWQIWLEGLGETSVDPRKGLRFNLSDLAIAAALAGEGVAVARLALVTDDLEQGRLVPLSNRVVPLPARYMLLSTNMGDSRVRAFSAWLHEECAAYDAERRRVLTGLAGAQPLSVGTGDVHPSVAARMEPLLGEA